MGEGGRMSMVDTGVFLVGSCREIVLASCWESEIENEACCFEIDRDAGTKPLAPPFRLTLVLEYASRTLATGRDEECREVGPEEEREVLVQGDYNGLSQLVLYCLKNPFSVPNG